MNAKYSEVAEVLNANRAPLPVVLDMADLFTETDSHFNRPVFVALSTTAALDEASGNLKTLIREMQGAL